MDREKEGVLTAELLRDFHAELDANGVTDKADAMWMRLLALRAERRRKELELPVPQRRKAG